MILLTQIPQSLSSPGSSCSKHRFQGGFHVFVNSDDSVCDSMHDSVCDSAVHDSDYKLKLFVLGQKELIYQSTLIHGTVQSIPWAISSPAAGI